MVDNEKIVISRQPKGHDSKGVDLSNLKQVGNIFGDC